MEFRTAFFFLCFVFVSCVHARHPLIGAQVFIEPGQSRENIEGWFRLLDQHHMNVCRIRMFEDHVKTGTDAWDFSLYDFAFDMAKKYNVKILATLFPSDSGSVGGFKFPKDQQHLESVGRFIDTVVQHYKSHPALDTWVLQNEPGVGDYQKTPLSLAKFEQWQQDRSSGKNSSGYLKVPLDWELFWRDYTTWYLRWIAERIRKYDTVSQTHVNNHQLFINLPQYDFPAWMSFLNTLGASIHAAWHLGYFNRDQYTLGILANCDIIRDAAEPKPFWITELQGGNNIFSGMDPLCPSPEDMNQWLWACIGSGAERIIFWTLNPRAGGAEAGEWAMVDFLNRPSERLTAAGKIAEILEKHDFFSTAKPVHPTVTLIYSPETMIILGEKILSNDYDDAFAGRKRGAHIKSLLAYYETLNELGISCQVKQADHFNWSTDDHQHRTAILANMAAIPSSLYPELYRFVENGNKLIITGMSGFFDENMHNVWQTSQPLRKLLGATLTEYKFIKENFSIDLSDPHLTMPVHMLKGEIHTETAQSIGPCNGQTVAIRHQYGKGNVVWIPSLVGLGAWQRDNRPLAHLLATEIQDKTPFRLTGHIKNVQLRVLESTEAYATVFINSGELTREITFVPSGFFPRVIFGNPNLPDVDKGKINLAPQETVVLLWKK